MVSGFTENLKGCFSCVLMLGCGHPRRGWGGGVTSQELQVKQEFGVLYHGTSLRKISNDYSFKDILYMSSL